MTPNAYPDNRKYCQTLLLFVTVFIVSIWTVNAQAPSGATTPAKPESPAAGADTQPATDETPPAKATPYPLSVKEVKIPSDGSEAGLGDKIIVVVGNLKEELERQQDPKSEVPEAERIDLRKFVLFLDEIEMKKLYPLAVVPELGELHYKLRRDSDTRDAWLNFLARPGSASVLVKASVGPEGKTPLPSEKTFTLRRYYANLLNWTVVLYLLILIGFLIAAKKTAIIRDSGPPNPEGGPLKRPYSLARAQVAWWFFIILGAFLFIALVTWDIDTITTSSLVLLGIGTGTALGAAMVDSNKRESSNSDLRTLKPQEAKLEAVVDELKTKIEDAETKLAADGDQTSLTASLASWRTEFSTKEAELEQVKLQVADAASGLQKPVSEGVITDFLSDVNGVTFHRFQILVWTIVLGLIFIYSVWNNLTMPSFPDTLLALMGISAGTYIGFKIPEQQTKPGDDANSDNTNAGDANAGDANAGDANAVDANAGNANAGNANAGDANAGNANAGNANAGNANAGNANAGDANAGDANAGNANAGDNENGG